jgi:C1A family cysteine protease
MAIKLPSVGMLDNDHMPEVRDQGDLGSCTGFATVACIDYTRRHLKQDAYALSPLFAYYNGRVIENTVNEDSGCEIRDVLKAQNKLGCAKEEDWPYKIDWFKKRPPWKVYENARQDMLADYRRIGTKSRLRLIKTAVIRREPVVFGFSVYENFDLPIVENEGLLPMPGGDMVGGHAVWICGYDDDMRVHDKFGAVLIQNSYGEWGCEHPVTRKRGYFWMPYEYLVDDNLCDDFWALRVVT